MLIWIEMYDPLNIDFDLIWIFVCFQGMFCFIRFSKLGEGFPNNFSRYPSNTGTPIPMALIPNPGFALSSLETTLNHWRNPESPRF